MKILIAFLISFSVGAVCRYFDIPCPAPNAILGALLVVATTIGYWAMGHFLGGS